MDALSFQTGNYTFISDASGLTVDIKASTTATFNVAQHLASLTIAGTAPLEPGAKNRASVMLLPTGVNRRGRLKVLKIVP